MTKRTRIHIIGLDRHKPVNLFTYAAFAASGEAGSLTRPKNYAYARKLVDNFHLYWQTTSFEDASVIVYAHQYTNCLETQKIAREVQEARKPLVFLESGENEPPSTVEYGKVFRQSIFGSQRQPCEHACASMHSDLLSEHKLDSVSILPKQTNPSLGFCGYVGTPTSRLFLRLLRQNQKADGLVVRRKVLGAFATERNIECKFIPRNKYLGMASLASFNEQSTLKQERLEFSDNIFGCAYGIAVRGKGNHSVRFYEMLSAGRIPVFVNTDCVLPFEDQINYREHVVWIEYDQLSEGGRILTQFNNRISPEEFSQMQTSNRLLWEEWLSPLGFHRKAVAV